MTTNLKFKINYLFPLLISFLLLCNCDKDDTPPVENENTETPTETSGELKLDSLNPESVNENSTETSTPTNSESLVTSQFTADAEKLLELVNKERLSMGLNALKLNKELSEAALIHSEDMRNNIKGLNHTGSDGSSFSQRIRRQNYDGSPRAENIARGQQTAEIVHRSWMDSPPHRKNILTQGITEMGIGRDGNFWTQVFGSN